MNKNLLRISVCAPWLAVLSLALLAGSSAAEEGGASKPPKASDESKPSDPTKPSPKLREALREPEKAQAPARAEVRKSLEISLKGLIQTEGKRPAAILDVKGKGLILINEATQFTVHDEAGIVKVAVRAISANAVQLEIIDTKETILLQ